MRAAEERSSLSLECKGGGRGEGPVYTLNRRAFAARSTLTRGPVSPQSRGDARGPLLVLLLAFFLPLTGCTSGRRVTIHDWQDAVIDYVNDEAAGRPGILRDVTIKGGRRGFAVLGHPRPDKAQDAVGLLLAHRSVAGRPTFIYLVAQVTRQNVKDLRLALLSERDGELRWHLSPDNDQALDTYLDWRPAHWKALYPDRNDAPLSYQGFPLEDDAFDVSVAQGEIVAQHPASGARWSIPIPATQPAADFAAASDR
jgi:hypothetical protein